jgi:hypothetical protein
MARIGIGLALIATFWRPGPVFGAASVKVSLSVSPTVAAYEQEVEWRIHLEPVGGTVSGYGIYLQPDRAASFTFTRCTPACGLDNRTQTAGWGNVAFSAPIDLKGYGYAPAGGGAFSVTVMAVPTSDTPCASITCGPSATLKLPESNLTMSASKTTVAPGETVHIQQIASANVPMDLATTSRLPNGLSDPTNVQPEGSWYAPTRQMEWQKANTTQLKVSYDTVVTAPAGSSLTIQGYVGGHCSVCAKTLTLKVANPATPKPSASANPTASARPSATPRSSATPRPLPTPMSTASTASSASASATPTPTPSHTPTPTASATATSSAIDSPTPAGSSVTTPAPSPSSPGELEEDGGGTQVFPAAAIAIGTGAVAAGGWFAGMFLLRRRRLH